jgi:hypothetical protein
MVVHNIVIESWDCRINDELVTFDECNTVTDFMTESVEAQV